MGAYHQLWQIEKSFRMSKTDLRARPIYHHKRDSIEAHLTIVFAALAVTRWLEQLTDWSIKKLVTRLRRYHTVEIQAGDQTKSGLPLEPFQLLSLVSRSSARPVGFVMTESTCGTSRCRSPAPGPPRQKSCGPLRTDTDRSREP
jgi:hypothetical protein